MIFYVIKKSMSMKSGNNNINKNQQGTPQHNKRRSAPEIRDNLDSRKTEEQDFKGDDVTHNRKEHHNKPNQKNK
jgi:hypothetical protein